MAYYDCAQRTASVPKRKAITLPKNNKRKTGLSGSNSSIEIIYHDQLPNTGGYEPQVPTIVSWITNWFVNPMK